MDLGVLIDNGKEAKDFQISQKRCQLKNKTHSQYVKQFLDIVNINVVSKISQSEMDVYTGPFKFITHYEVYKPGSLYTPVCLVPNKSFKNGSTNINNITVKGPNTLADILDNLLKFRS